jgi:malate dehydrogenase (oxaloacetate-decarboxylating)
VLEALQQRLAIPVWHDDQQGTATVLVAALLNALEVTGKARDRVRIAMIGMGAANVSTYRLLGACGIAPQQIVACDRNGTLHRGRTDIERLQGTFVEKWQVCLESNPDGVRGGIAEALRGADVCIAFSASGPGVIDPAWIRGMADDAIVFACANPIPEIWPWLATEAGARIVATGRCDFPNQVNNSLVFPAVFRGTLDAEAGAITDAMALAAARALALAAQSRGLSPERILPSMDEWEVVPCVAAAVAVEAQARGLSQLAHTASNYEAMARRRIADARRALAGVVEPP